MKLIGKLAENVSNAKSREEARELIRSAGMELSDDEMAQVTGGSAMVRIVESNREYYCCTNGHKHTPVEARNLGYICDKCGATIRVTQVY